MTVAHNDQTPEVSLPSPLRRPFLKWAGGKRQLLPLLLRAVPHHNRYFEPFLGGGALFFALGPTRAFLSDVNPELVNCYVVVRDRLSELCAELKTHFYDRDYYYHVRNADRSLDFAQWSDVSRAARFIFLNRTCFNGLYRVNSRGHFNVPFGKYANPQIVNEPLLMACSSALRGTQISAQSFCRIADFAKRGDFVYFDPPYAPISPTSNFRSYTKEGFDSELQTTLAEVFAQLDRKGVKVLLSNSATPFILELYGSYNAVEIPARRAISARQAGRSPVQELLIANYPLPSLA